MRIDQTITSYSRLRQIANVLIKHGLGVWVDRTRLRYFASIGGLIKRLSMPKNPASMPERLREAMEELGPTYIKLGQMLSMRPDMIPLSWTLEFSKLQDATQPFAWSDAVHIIETELGKPISTLFRDIDPEPLACASLSEVHSAILLDGSEVVVKVRRPGIERLIEADLVIMRDLADYVRQYLDYDVLNPVDVLDEFAITIRRELDFNMEAGNLERLRKDMSGLTFVHVPKVYWEYTTAAVLTMSHLPGVKYSNITEESSIDKVLLSHRLVECFLTQVFDFGYFHADPHPGNILFDEQNNVGILDCGMMGQIGTEQLEHMAGLLVGLVQKDSRLVVDEYLQLTDGNDDANMQILETDITHLINRFWGLPLEKIDLTSVIDEVLKIASRHKLHVSSEFTMLARMILILESFSRRLNPGLNIVEIATPMVTRLMQRKYSPGNIWRHFTNYTRELEKTLSSLPGNIRIIGNKLSKGRMSLEVRHSGLEALGKEMDRSSKRVTLGLVTAAIIIGSSIIMLSDQYPRILGYPWLGFVGFALASLFALVLIISLLRRNR